MKLDDFLVDLIAGLTVLSVLPIILAIMLCVRAWGRIRGKEP